MKIERLITIVMMLLANDAIPASRFAALFQVSKRTILRDMDALSAAHIPVVASRGVKGGFSLLDSYKFDKRLLSVADLQNILTAVSGLDALMVADDVSATLTKIQGMLPATAPDGVQLDFQNAKQMQTTVATLRQAIQSKHLVAFDYFSREGVATSRQVEPYRLLWHNQTWYLVAWSLERHAWRTFRLSRMRTLKQTATAFVARPNVPQTWSGSGMPETKTTVLVRVAQANRAWVIEHFGQQVIIKEDDQALEAKLALMVGPEAFRFFAQCGTGLQVLAPADVGAQYVAYLQAMIDKQTT